MNVLSETIVTLAGKRASKVKLTMQEPHPLLGMFQGRAVYGIKSLAVMAPRLEAVTDDCASAAKSGDARDKYFAAQAPEFDLAAAAPLQNEAPALESAVSSLSASLSQLSAKIPQLPTCSPNPAAFVEVMKQESRFHAEPAAHARASMMKVATKRRAGVNPTAANMAVGETGVDTVAVQQLLMAAKSAVVAVRSVLL